MAAEAVRRGAHGEVDGGARQPEAHLRDPPRRPLLDRGGRPAGEPEARRRRPDPRGADAGAQGARTDAQDHRRPVERGARAGRARRAALCAVFRTSAMTLDDRPADLVDLRLYVTGATPASARAVVNARRFCETHLAGRYRLEVLDIG